MTIWCKTKSTKIKREAVYVLLHNYKKWQESYAKQFWLDKTS